MRTIKRDIVGAFIFSKDDKLLLGKSTRATYEGMWIVPGGGVESDESFRDALIREVLEETGLDIAHDSIESMEIDLTGTSEKILKETGERVIGEYTFYNFIVRIDRKAEDIPVKADDDFSQATWWALSDLENIKLSPPTITTLQNMELLA